MDEHFLRELQHIQLIQKKLIQKLENTQNVDNPEHIPEIIEDLDQFSNFTTSLTKTITVIKEIEMEKMILGKMVQNEEKKNFQLSRKHILTIAGFIVVIGIVITAYSLFVVQLVGQEYKVPNTGSRNDGYIIQNLSGETINTWLSWRLVDGTVLHVNVIDADKYPGKLDLIKEVLLSQQAIEIDDSLLGNGPKGSTSTYYTGWGGA